MSALRSLVAIVAVAVLAGCTASGPLFTEVSSAIPAVPAGKGRIYFYRLDTMFGGAVTSDITLNGRVVGKSERGSFFFVDENPGACKASASTEVERQANFNLAAGETKYVRTRVSMGALVGHIQVDLVSPGEAKNEINDLHYTGAPLTKY